MIKEAAKFFLLSLLCGSAFCGQEIKVPLTVVDDIASPGTTYLSVQSGGVTIDPDLTLSNLTATRLLASDGSKLVVSVADLASWIAGTTNEITITNDGDGTVTISLPDAVVVGTIDTGQGATEVYAMDQGVMTSNSPTFQALTINTDLSVASGGTGVSSLDDVVGTANEITVTAGADSIIGGDVTISLPDDVTIGTLDTGQGGNELYDMDQNVKTTNSPTFAGLTLTADLTVANGGTGASSLDDIVGTSNEIEVTAGADTVIGGDVTIGLPDAVTVVTLNTGQGANELYDMDQNVQTDSAVTFETVDTGQGATELYDMNQDIQSDDAVTFVTVNTGEGANELYDMNQDVQSDDAVTFLTVDTGQGANELYDMDQNVQTGDGVTFATVNTGQGANELYDMDQNVLTSSNVEFGDAALDGNVDLGDASGDFITVVGKIDADIIPYTSAAPGLGDGSNYWTDAYITDLFVGDDITMGTTDRLILDDTAGDGPVFMSHARLEQASANTWYNVLTYDFHIDDGAVSIFWVITVWDGTQRAMWKGLDLFYTNGGTIAKQSGWADFAVRSDYGWNYAVATWGVAGLRIAIVVDNSADTTFDVWYVITESEE